MGSCMVAKKEEEQQPREQYNDTKEENEQFQQNKSIRDATNMIGSGLNDRGSFGIGNENDLCTLAAIHKDKEITEVYCGNQFNIFCDKKNQTYWSAGVNSGGQCALGRWDDLVKNLTKISFFTEREINIKKCCVSLNSFTVFWITESNELYGNGWNKQSQLGLDDDSKRSAPVCIPYLKNVMDVKSGTGFSIALCAIFNVAIVIEVWIKGNIKKNDMGILKRDVIDLIAMYCGTLFNDVFAAGELSRYTYSGGVQSSISPICCSKWTKIERLSNENIIQIETGDSHVLFLSMNGSVWCYGGNKYGQLGSGNKTDRAELEEIKYFKENEIKIKKIKCGENHNLAIDFNDNIYCWGADIYHTTDELYNIGSICTPRRISFFDNYLIKDIKCGTRHSYIRTVNDEHFIFGDNGFKQCLKETNGIQIADPYLMNKTLETFPNFNPKKANIWLGNQCTFCTLE